MPNRRTLTVLLSLIGIYAGMNGILSNTIGLFFSAVLSELGFRTGDLSIYHMIRALVTAAAVGPMTAWYLKSNGKKAMLCMEILFISSFVLMSFCSSLYQFYICAVLAGLGGSCFIVVLSIVLNNWFIKNKGLALGIAMSSSGLAGALLSPRISRMILDLGWRSAMQINCLFSAALILIPTLLWFIPDPKQINELPFGAEQTDQSEQIVEPETRANMKGSIFIFATMAVLLPGTLCQFTAQMPVFAGSLGYDLKLGGLLTSCCMIGNVMGKLLIGVLSDRIGIYRTVQVFAMTIGISAALFLTCGALPTLLCAAAILFGCVYGHFVNTQPLLLLDLYGKDYKMKMSRMQALGSLFSALLSVAIPYIYDFTGSWSSFFLYAVLACVIALFSAGRLKRFAERDDPIEA